MTFRVGLRLALNSGREALIRLMLIAAAVAAGVGVLLSVLAAFSAFSATNNRQCWECTNGARLTAGTRLPAAKAELWNYSKDYYEGRVIERLDVAVPGPGAPVIPGLTRMPGPGQMYVSPALASLLKSVPADELGARFPGTQVGKLGDAALYSPDELAVVVGYRPQQLAALPATQVVRSISARAAVSSTSAAYTSGFGLIMICLVVPLAVLIGTATRMAAARREERFAALRLIGATSGQVSVIASVDAVVAAVIGTVAGLGVFRLLQPSTASIEFTGARYFSSLVSPSGLEYLITLAGVPAAAAFSALWSLRRVRVSPLGTARKTTPPAPHAWRVLPLLIGLALFITPIAISGKLQANVFPLVDLGLVLIMTGLVIGGSWLTMQAARLVAVLGRGAPSVLAARRLANDPRGTFRSVSGLVLAVFLGTAIAGIVPALLSSQQNVGGGTLNGVLRASFTAVYPGSTTASFGLSPDAGAQVLGKLRSYPGVAVLPLYVAPGQRSSTRPPGQPGSIPQHKPPAVPGRRSLRQPGGISCGAGGCTASEFILSCQSLKQFSTLGRCAAGVTAVRADFGTMLISESLRNASLPIVGRGSTAAAAGTGRLTLGAVLVRTKNAATLERVRTLLTQYTARSGTAAAPMTFGEAAQARSALYDEIQQVALVVVWLTIFVAGCSLAVAVGAGMVERKRPFTLVRLTGTPARVLYGVVLLESAVPLLTAAVVAAGAGLAVAAPVVGQFTQSTSVAMPGSAYFLTTGAGILASLLVIAAALPLLKRLTDPGNVRFE